MSDPSIGALLRGARSKLDRASFDVSTREGALLLSHVLGRGEAGILAHPEETVPAAAALRFQELLERRMTGEPVAYLFGEREFYGRPFNVDPRVLIPRPETEHLIEAALALDLPPKPCILDIGTGSGCIAITLALERPDARLVATDLSFAALRVAQSNTLRHGVADRVTLVGSDLATGLRPGPIDLVVSNPPYVDQGEQDNLSIEVRGFEPHLALFAPGRGASMLARLLDEMADLQPGTHLAMEIGYDQSEWLQAATNVHEAWELVKIVEDYSSIPRTAVLRRLA